MSQFVRTIGIALCVTTLAMCGPSGMEMVGDAMVDVGQAIRDGGGDATSDAAAQASCATCNVSGAMRVVTADTDVAQQFRGRGVGVESGFTHMHIVSGPAIITDVFEDDSPGLVELRLTQTTCEDGSGDFVANLVRNGGLSGAHIFVPAGSSLCARVTSSSGVPVEYTWSGYRPYE